MQSQIFSRATTKRQKRPQKHTKQPPSSDVKAQRETWNSLKGMLNEHMDTPDCHKQARNIKRDKSVTR